MHNRGQLCEMRPKDNRLKDKESHIIKFRNSQLWKNKSKEIRSRDTFLCQWCKMENKLVFKGLEVHHIEKLSNNFKKRLDNFNLVTLCQQCHKMADDGKISKKDLLQLVAIIEKRGHVL